MTSEYLRWEAEQRAKREQRTAMLDSLRAIAENPALCTGSEVTVAKAILALFEELEDVRNEVSDIDSWVDDIETGASDLESRVSNLEAETP